MKKKKKIPDNQIAVYQTPEEGINIVDLWVINDQRIMI